MYGTKIPEIEKLLSGKCSCGKQHTSPVKGVLIGKGVINQLSDVLKREYSPKKIFILADKNTYKAAGEKLCRLFDQAGLAYSKYVFDKDEVEPDEESVGSVMMHYDKNCDLIVGVGSGVINDIGKILGSVSRNPYVIVGTAPSMDGYASDSSSVNRDGLKYSLYSTCAELIVGDTDILCNAPEISLKSGLGDMLAKYISICEWKLAKIICGDYYCKEIANLIKAALKCCTDNAEGLLKRDEAAVEAVFKGLVIGGIAMCFAGISRPASGGEHYISHIWDMRKAALGTYCNTHGIQCAVGTYTCARMYEKILNVTPDKEKALEYVSKFDYADRKKELEDLLGNGARSMILLEEKEGKFDKAKHAARLEIILENWDEIVKIIKDEIPSVATLDKIYDAAGIAKTPAEAGLDNALLPITFKVCGDIRDKYVLSRLVWDLGLMDEFTKALEYNA